MHIGQAEFLFYLAGVAMPHRCECSHRAAPFRMMRRERRRIAPLARSNFDVHDDWTRRVEQMCARQRQQREIGRGRVAAHAAHVLRVAYFVAMQFGQAVHKFADPVRRAMRFAVPFFVRRQITQAKIRAQIHDARRERGERLDALLRFAVRQRKEQHIAWLQLIGGGELNFGAPA